MSSDDWYIVLAVLAAVGIVVYVAGEGASEASDGTLSSNPIIAAGDSAASSVLSAISSFENVASSHNNPGGICGSFDSNGNCLGPATYSSLSAGWSAAESKIETWIDNNPALTVEQFVAKWSGATGQVLQNYIDHVSTALGLDPSDPIADAGSDDSDENGFGVDF